MEQKRNIAVWSMLVLIPFAQAIFVAMSQMAINRVLYAEAFVYSVALNLCWWANTRRNQDTRHLKMAGLVYAISFSTGITLGMWFFQKS